MHAGVLFPAAKRHRGAAWILGVMVNQQMNSKVQHGNLTPNGCTLHGSSPGPAAHQLHGTLRQNMPTRCPAKRVYHANNCFTTLPATSVSRKSRPWKR